jgi:hypothetical protein
MTSPSAQAAAEIFATRFCDRRSRNYLSIKPIAEPREILADAVYQFDVEHERFGACSARMYMGLSNKLAERLWIQETQSLRRLTARGHPALPRVCESDFWEDRSGGVGAIVSDAPGSTISAADVEIFRAEPTAVIRYLRLAADALRTLHANGLIHRDIWREAFDIWDPRDGRNLQLRLTRFEMSAFAASLADPSWRMDEEERAMLREYRDRGGVERRACRAPEVLSGEEGEGASGGIALASDIYSLGVCAFQWLVGDIPEVDRSTAIEPGTQYAQYVDARLGEATALPSGLRGLLRRMVSARPANRPTASDVVGELAAIEDVTTVRTEADQPYILAIAPDFLARYTQIDDWKPFPPDDLSLLPHFRALIQNDLADGVLIHYPKGASGFVQGGDADQQAKCVWVLLGKRAVYFCHPYIAQEGARAAELDSVLHLDYAVDRNRDLKDIGLAALRRRIPRVKVVHFVRGPEVIPETAKRLKCPSWKPLLREVLTTEKVWDGESEFRKGIEWWLRVNRAGIDIQAYAFKRVPIPTTRTAAGNDLVRLAVDLPRDQAWIEGDPMRDLLARMHPGRPSFGDFFGMLRDRDHEGTVSWADDYKGHPDREGFRNSGSVRPRGLQEVELELKPGVILPEIGWLRPGDLRGDESLLRNQTAAAAALFERPELMRALHEPEGRPGPISPWQDVAPGLRGNAREIVKEMLSYQPFYGLQGPPGTGKSTVVANGVSSFLERRPSARVLVSAQSHYALDEIAGRIVKLAKIDGASDLVRRLGRSERLNFDWSDLVALRVASPKVKVAPVMEEYFDSKQANARLEVIKQRPVTHAADRRTLLSIAADWKSVAERCSWDIQERIWKSANLVFATTGMCTDDYLGEEGFDWVIVEEAAKAWCAELIMPLVRGERWTLIGDHKQLAPFGEIEIAEIYAASRASLLTDVNSLSSDSEAFKATLELFGSLFKRAAKRSLPELAADEEWGEELPHRLYGRWALNHLNTQFRMDDRILQIVKAVFYDDELYRDPKKGLVSDATLCSDKPLHGFDGPDYIRDRAVVWLDTSELESCRYEREHWWNEGEALVIRNFLAELSPNPFQRADAPTLAILSPYNRQNDVLRQKLPTEAAELVHTTDSFQGREADVVIVSLVRTNGESVEQPLRRIGHLKSPARTNVLLSRAKKLLVIVGDIVHFETTTGTCWEKICGLIRAGRNVITLRSRQ